MLLRAGSCPSSEHGLWSNSQQWWQRALNSIVGMEVTRITLVFRVARRLEEPVSEEKPRNTLGVDRGEGKKGCRPEMVGPSPHWPHP